MADEISSSKLEIGSCSPDEENSCSLESQMLSKASPNLDLNDYETMEELDFEDEKKELDDQKYSNILQPSFVQNLNQNGSKNIEMGAELKCIPSDLGKENCGESDIEEGETVDDGECIDVEDGEISEAFKTEDLQKISCRFYQRGKCIWGRECRYLHLSDKGLYNMFDSPVKQKKPSLQNIYYSNETKFMYEPPPPPPPPPLVIVKKKTENPWVEKSSDSLWDRALQEAKDRIKKSKMCQDDAYLEENMHVKVNKDDRCVKTSSTSKYSLDSPGSESEKVRHYSFPTETVETKQKKWKYSDHSKSNVSKSIVDRKTSFHSDWKDPWRRSKTPPKRKRKKSESSSDSSTLSDSSLSSWTSISCHSSSYFKGCPKKGHSQSHAGEKSRSCSSSSKKSTSSFSRSASPKYRARSHHRDGKSYRSPSSSPVYHRRKRHCSPGVILPYHKPRSVTPPAHKKERGAAKVEKQAFSSFHRLLPNKKFQSSAPLSEYHKKERAASKTVKKLSAVASKQGPLPNSHSVTSKPVSATTHSGSYHSNSDMSISPVSDSSLSKISFSPVSNNKAKNNFPLSDASYPKKNEPCFKTIASEPDKGHLHASSFKKDDKSKRSESSPKSCDKKQKNFKSLEADFFLFVGKKKLLSDKEEPKSHPTGTSSGVTDNSAKTDPHFKRSKEMPKWDILEKRLSKRDVLLQKLRAVEEAIARKKKIIGSS